MPRLVLPKAETAQACRGIGGEYVAWTHYPTANAGIQLVRFLLGEATAVEKRLALPQVKDPWAVLASVERLSDQARRKRWLNSPSDITITRWCRLGNHADGAVSATRSGRHEIAARLLWVPEGAEPIPIRPSSPKINAEGIGTATALDRKIGRIPHVTSVALTLAERADPRYQATDVIQTVPVNNIEATNFALIHGRLGQKCLEGVHYLPVA